MATLSADQAHDTLPRHIPNHGLPGKVYGSYALTSNPAQDDTLILCRIPKGAFITGGKFYSDALDGNESPTLAVKCGYGSNDDALFSATAGTYATATRLSFALFPASVAHTGIYVHPEDENIFLTWTETAATFAAGSVFIEIDYMLPINA